MYGRKASELVKEFASCEPGQISTFNNGLHALMSSLGLRTWDQTPQLRKMRVEKILDLLRSSSVGRSGVAEAPRSKGDYNDLFAQVLEECDGHLLHLQPLMRKIQEHENELKDKRRSEEEMGISEDETRNSEAEKTLIQNALKSDQFGALVHHLSLVRNKRCLMAYIYKRAEVIRSLGWMVDSVLPEEIQEKLSTAEKEYFKNHTAALQSYMGELDLHLTVDMIPPKDPYIKVRVLDDIGEIALSDQVANVARHAIMFLRRTDAEQYITQGQMEELTG